MAPMMVAPCDAKAEATFSSAARRTAGSRITPLPRLTSTRPASNWGFTSTTMSAVGTSQRAGRTGLPTRAR